MKLMPISIAIRNDQAKEEGALIDPSSLSQDDLENYTVYYRDDCLISLRAKLVDIKQFLTSLNEGMDNETLHT